MAKRVCANCGNTLESSSLFCPKCGSKQKQKNMFLFFILMSILFFFVLEVVFSLVGGLLFRTISTAKYGQDSIMELLLVCFMLIVLAFAGNSYVFREKKVGFFKGLLVSLPMLIFTCLLLLTSLVNLVENFNLFNIISLLFFCALVGMAEEFLCRAWLQNEFIERFGSSAKGIIGSILCASFIFGAMHITNALVTPQSLIQTIFQIFQAMASGFLFGVIYYKTKNIWSSAFLHGFFDFSLMLGEVGLLKDCISNPANEYVIVSAVSSVIIMLFYIFCALFAMSLKTGNKIVSEKTRNRLRPISIVGFILAFIGIFIPNLFVSSDLEPQICYTFNDKEIKEDYYVTVAKKKSFKFGSFDGEIELTSAGSNLILSSANGTVELKYDNPVEDYIVIDNNETVDILIHTNFVESIIYHTRLNKADISDSLDYLKSIKNSLEKIDVPDLKSIGYITFDGDDTKYPYMLTKLDKEFFIDDIGDLYLIK